MTIYCYQRHINDWKRDTSFLSLLQRGVYSELLDNYYLSDGTLPSDLKCLKRIIGVSNRPESEALEYIVNHFFTIVDGKLFQKRASQELANIKSKKQKASANARCKSLKDKETQQADAEPTLSGRSANHKPITNIEDKSSLSYSPFSSFENSCEKQALEKSLNRPRVDIDELSEAVNLWDELASELGLPKISKMTSQRKTKLKARLKDCGGIEGWKIALSKIRLNDWMHAGKNDRGWKASFDFVLQESSFVKLMEGSYDARTNKNQFTNGYAQQLTEMLETGDFNF